MPIKDQLPIQFPATTPSCKFIQIAPWGNALIGLSNDGSLWLQSSLYRPWERYVDIPQSEPDEYEAKLNDLERRNKELQAQIDILQASIESVKNSL